MHGICLDYPLQDWFEFKIPNTKILPDYIISCLEKESDFNTKPSAKIIWIGGKPSIKTFSKSKKGHSWQMIQLTFQDKTDTFEIALEEEKGNWLVEILELLSYNNENSYTFTSLKTNFETNFEDFELFWYSKPLLQLRQHGLVVL